MQYQLGNPTARSNTSRLYIPSSSVVNHSSAAEARQLHAQWSVPRVVPAANHGFRRSPPRWEWLSGYDTRLEPASGQAVDQVTSSGARSGRPPQWLVVIPFALIRGLIGEVGGLTSRRQPHGCSPAETWRGSCFQVAATGQVHPVAAVTASGIAIMTNLDLNLSQWYTNNEDGLDYRTPDLPVFGSRGTSPAANQPQRSGHGLPLLQLADWDPNLSYDESPPTCIHYSIEWKLQLEKGRLVKLTNDTEQNLVLAPGAFWDQTLKSKLQQLLTKKTPRNKSYEPDETNVVVSVTDRSQRDLTKRFDELEIDWEVVEDQLMAWSDLFRDGKRLRIDISFIYKEATPPVAIRTQ